MNTVQRVVLIGVLFCFSGNAKADVIVPGALAATEADGTFSLFSTSLSRIYQMTIDSSQLNSVVGQNLTGFQIRLNGTAGANWPPADFTFSQFDVFMGPGVDPSAMSNTFTVNYTGPVTQVRSGSQTFQGGAFSSGSSPNAFGPTINFNTPYLYTGGDLTMELQFSTNGSGASFSADAVLASGGPANGWGVNFAARWTGNVAGGTGANGNFIVTNFLTGQAIPEPSSLGVCALGITGWLVRRKR